MQATVTPAPDADPPPGSGQNTGVSGTRHSVAPGGGHGPAAGGHGPGRRPRAIRYAHSDARGPASAAAPVQPGSGPDQEPGAAASGAVLSGVVLPGHTPVGGPVKERPDDETAGLVYETPRPGSPAQAPAPPRSGAGVPNRPVLAVEPTVPGEPGGEVANEGLGIFGGVASTEASDDPPARRAGGRPRYRPQRTAPPGAGPRAERAQAAGPAWNQTITSPPVPNEEAEESKPNPFWRVLGMLRGPAGAEDDQPRVSVRDLPPDVQVRLWRMRITIMVIVGAVVAAVTRNWEIALTLAILAGIVDTVHRSRNAAFYVMSGPHPGARKETSKQLAKMRREGYYTLDARPIPDSQEVIDHLVIGPTGVYAIDSERWNPKLPIRISNGKRLFLGPESQKERLEHAVWEASQASELLSAALGREIQVRPALAIYGPQVPWDIVTIRNVDVFTGSALRRYLKRRSGMRRGKGGVPVLSAEEVRVICDAAATALPDVNAPSQTTSPVG